MALSHASQGDVVDVRPYGSHIGGARSIALFKSSQLEVMRLVFTAGHRLPVHQVAGEITLQCLEGEVQVTVAGQPHTLPAGHLMYVAAHVPHELMAEVPASVLVTIVL